MKIDKKIRDKKTSQTVKAVKIAIYNIQQHFIRDIRAKFGIPNLIQSPDIG